MEAEEKEMEAEFQLIKEIEAETTMEKVDKKLQTKKTPE